MTSTNLDHQINLGSRIASKANLASVIKVTFEPSMAIHWLVLSRLQRAKISTTLLPKIMMMLIGKKGKEKNYFHFFVPVIQRISYAFYPKIEKERFYTDLKKKDFSHTQFSRVTYYFNT